MTPRYLCKSALVLMIAAASAGCLSPATLRPVAGHNSTNISNYNHNVAALCNALRSEAALHGQLQLQIARNSLADSLIKLPQKWLGSMNPADRELADPDKEPHKSLLAEIEVARNTLSNIRDGLSDQAGANLAVASRHPLVADIVLETPGFTTLRVIRDAFSLVRLNSDILAETDPHVRRAFLSKRARLLDQYMLVRLEAELVTTHLEALDEYLALVAEQGQVAASHANTISAYANAAPQVSTLASALQDEQLRGGILDLIRRKKGDDYAARIDEYMNKADDVFAIIDGLSK